MNKKYFVICLFSILLLTRISAYEKIHSSLNTYYKTLSLYGITESPNLNFSTASLNTWKTPTQEHPWMDQKLNRTELWNANKSKLYFLDTELFQSYNLNTPYGMNDSGLWQGKGYNLALSGGFLFESPYLDISIYPELYFSQNQDFTIQIASPTSGSEYGYYNSNIDTPQRFGSDPFWYGSFGQSQIRAKYKNWTLGLGNENVWIGPGQQSALISSNNADGFPHIDFGLRKTETKAGYIEFFTLWGFLKSSEYYTHDPGSYKDFLSGLYISYAPVFLPGFTLGFNRTSQVKLENIEFYSLISSFDFGLSKAMGNFGRDVYDGRASVTWSWVFDQAGFEFYGEWAREDYSSGLEGWLRIPEHADGFILGINQAILLKKDKQRMFVLNAEFSSLVWSMDYFIGLGWGNGFYRHGYTNLGYANNGQSIGAGFGTGGNMQYLSVDYICPNGLLGFYATRIKYDDSQLYTEGSNVGNPGEPGANRIPYQIAVGPKGEWKISNGLSVKGEIAYIFDKNWNMIEDNDFNGFYINSSIVYRY